MLICIGVSCIISKGGIAMSINVYEVEKIILEDNWVCVGSLLSFKQYRKAGVREGLILSFKYGSSPLSNGIIDYVKKITGLSLSV